MSVFFGLSYEYDKILNEFLADIKKNYSYYSNHLSEIIDILADMERIIKAHPDNPEDVLDEIIQETIIDIEHFKKKYQMNFTLCELFSDIFWDVVFSYKQLTHT